MGFVGAAAAPNCVPSWRMVTPPQMRFRSADVEHAALDRVDEAFPCFWREGQPGARWVFGISHPDHRVRDGDGMIDGDFHAMGALLAAAASPPREAGGSE